VRERAFRLAERGLARASGRLVAVSDQVRDDLLALRIAPREKIVVIPYGFDLDRRVGTDPAARARRRQEVGAGDDTFVIGWAGRLTEIKRPLDLVRAAAAVDGSLLVLAGDGELREDVVLLARQLGVEDRVRLLGYVDEIADWYAAFDAFLLTSLNEGSPVAAIEAQAAGVPVVATDAGGTRTVVEDGETGFVVPIGDLDAIADRLRRLRDPETHARMAETGRARMRAQFSTERMIRDHERVYDDARRR
jgi:glycosyltransferase involved in cell wall biosynthesis